MNALALAGIPVDMLEYSVMAGIQQAKLYVHSHVDERGTYSEYGRTGHLLLASIPIRDTRTNPLQSRITPS